MRRAVLFDLGETLVGYIRPGTFGEVLPLSLEAAAACLEAGGAVLAPDWRSRVELGDGENADCTVRPMARRLSAVFGVAEGLLLDGACRAFLGPVFARAEVYLDTVPTLRALRAAGIKTGVLSNAPWGAPPEPWREELARLGLAPLLDVALFCGDTGYRKPAPPGFRLALDRMGVTAADTLFVGDRPTWDVDGPRAAGLCPVLIAREGEPPDVPGLPIIRTLAEVPALCGLKG